ncbi:hypothetical protein K438DRAFT_1830995 [Mycena galopus ATCC 62051]|nr:hypothetical protein K438DRAFT_1830995 [Mycena galopus ATCC 62051]
MSPQYPRLEFRLHTGIDINRPERSETKRTERTRPASDTTSPAHPDRCQRVATTQKHKDPPTRARLGRSVREHEYETNEGSAYRPRAQEGKHNEPARRENERGGGHWGKEEKKKTDLAIRLAGRHPAQPMRGRDGEWTKDNWRRSDGWEQDEGRDNAICSSKKGHGMRMRTRGGQVKLICRGKDSRRGTYYGVWFAFALSISRCWTYGTRAHAGAAVAFSFAMMGALPSGSDRGGAVLRMRVWGRATGMRRKA